MAVDKTLLSEFRLPVPVEEDLEIEIDDTADIVDSDIVIIESEDGTVTVDFSPQDSVMLMSDRHDSNLAEYIDEGELQHCASKLIKMYQDDRSSRADWERTYEEGLDLLGLEMEDRTTPWPGACGVFHPLLSESVVRFQAQTIQEIFPAKGPVKTKIWGEATEEITQQAHRVQEYMNYQLLEVMTEYRSETEKMLFSLPLAGAAFRKIYYDPTLGRPCSMFVPAQDFVIGDDETSLENAERYTHVMTRSSNYIRKLQVSGFYRDVELSPEEPSADVI